MKYLTYTLQHTATHCNTLQHTATHCNNEFNDISDVHIAFQRYEVSANVVINPSVCTYVYVHINTNMHIRSMNCMNSMNYMTYTSPSDAIKSIANCELYELNQLYEFNDVYVHIKTNNMNYMT